MSLQEDYMQKLANFESKVIHTPMTYLTRFEYIERKVVHTLMTYLARFEYAETCNARAEA